MIRTCTCILNLVGSTHSLLLCELTVNRSQTDITVSNNMKCFHGVRAYRSWLHQPESPPTIKGWLCIYYNTYTCPLNWRTTVMYPGASRLWEVLTATWTATRYDKHISSSLKVQPPLSPDTRATCIPRYIYMYTSQKRVAISVSFVSLPSKWSVNFSKWLAFLPKRTSLLAPPTPHTITPQTPYNMYIYGAPDSSLLNRCSTTTQKNHCYSWPQPPWIQVCLYMGREN